MKKWNRLLNSFWFWVLLVFLGNAIFTSYGLIQSNKQFKNNIKNSTTMNNISMSANYRPNEIGVFNNTYSEKLSGGKIIDINLKSIVYDDKQLIIYINSPNKVELSTYFNNFINFKVLNKNGDEITPSQIDFVPGKISKFVISGDSLSKAYWIVINPYKIEGNEPLVFYINKGY